MNTKDYFFDKDRFDLQAATISFLKAERQKLDDFLIDCFNECNGDQFELAMRFPEACDEAVRLDKRIVLEVERLKKLLG